MEAVLDGDVGIRAGSGDWMGYIFVPLTPALSLGF